MEILFTADGRRITTGQPYIYQGNSSRVMKLWDPNRYYDEGLYRSPQQPVCNCLGTQFRQMKRLLKDPNAFWGWEHQRNYVPADYNQ